MEWTHDVVYRALEAAQTDRSFDPDEYRYLQHLMDKVDEEAERERQAEMEE